MNEQTLVQLAQTGDTEAIALLMNSTLEAIGVQARVALREQVLYVLLESERTLAQTPCIEFIRRGIARLGMGWLSSAVVYSRLPGENSPLWVEQVPLQMTTLPNPFYLAADVALEGSTAIVRVPRRRKSVQLFDLMLLSIPLLVVFSSALIWNRYLSGLLPAIEGSSLVSGSSQPASPAIAAKDPYDLALTQAREAVKLGKTADDKTEWRQAVAGWQAAIAHLKAVPADHAKHAIAQQKIQEYQANVDTLIRDRVSQMGMELKKTIHGSISPKSIVYSGKDLFFAQNMMYSHSITVYDREYRLVKTIDDKINLADMGYPKFQGTAQGAPVEAAFSEGGNVAWVSNYEMSGAGFTSGAGDECSPAQNLDPSFLYRINTQSLNIERVVQVGAVPKFVATSPNNRLVLVSNWCSWDVSVVDALQNKEIRRLQVGPYPRGLVVDPASEKAYVAVMGSYDVAVIDLKTYDLSWIQGVGHSPRHLNIDPKGKYLYATLNGEGQVAKIDLATKQVVSKVATGAAPRSMAISGDGAFLYVVNYDSDSVSKIRTSDMQVVQTVAVNPAPIGITYDAKTHQVWVACYTGSILVFQD